MKKIFNMLLAAAALFAFVACSDDENVGRTFGNKSISIEKANLSFSDDPSTGQAIIKSDAPIAAVISSSEWCKASLSGNVITVEVPQNYEFTSRVAQLTIKAGADSLNIPVQQRGLGNFDVSGAETRAISPNDTTITLTYKHIEGIDVTANPHSDGNWIHATVDKGTVTVTLDANKGFANRSGYVRIRSGRMKRSREARITFNQDWDVSDHLKGEWTLSYFTALDTTNLTRQQVDCTFANDSIYFNFGSDGKAAFPFYKKLQQPYALLIRGSVRCSGKIKGATPYLYLSSDATSTWTGKQENTTVGGYLLRNAQGKLHAQLSGLIINDPKQVFTSMNIVTFSDAPATGFPSSDTGRSRYADYFFPIFIKK